jgi:hypothetical protein
MANPHPATKKVDRPTTRALLAWVVLVAGCRHDCIAIPGCPPPLGSLITVTSAVTHAAVNGITIQVNGDTVNVVHCDGTCLVGGSAGKYDLIIMAPGFQSTERTFTVTSSTKVFNVSGPDGSEGTSCGCDVVDEQQIGVALVPSA